MKKILPLAIAVLVVLAIAIYYSQKDSGSTFRKDQTDFAIADTASVGKIFIADSRGNTVTLVRQSDDRWLANNTYTARPDAIRILLITFKNIYVQRPVPKDAQEQVNRVMAGSAKKVEIYDLNNKWLKTWYVGYGTMDKKGTYMLLETPEFGKASAPYVMDKKGFLGMLDTRFFTDLDEWRSPRIFEYRDMNISEIEVDYPTDQEASFRIKYRGGNDISLFAKGSSTPIARFDTALVKDYMLNYKLASFENFKTDLSQAEQDSIKSQTPFQVIRVLGKEGEQVVRLWAKAAPEGQAEMDGETMAVIDRERVYAATSSDELALAQRLIWDSFRAPLQAFTDDSKK